MRVMGPSIGGTGDPVIEALRSTVRYRNQNLYSVR